MVKIANDVSILGPLRDIRLGGFKPQVNGKAHAGGTGGQNGNGNGAGQGNRGAPNHSPPKPAPAAAAPVRVVPSVDEETVRAREQAAYERGARESEERFARQVEQLKAEWETQQKAEVRTVLGAMQRGVQTQINEALKLLERELTGLAMDASVKLVSGLPISVEMVEACIREIIGMVEQGSDLTIVLHPADLVLLEQHNSAFLDQDGGAPVIRFRPDQKMSRGGCLVETKFGELDARRETKAAMLKRAVTE